jgi:hypothetical protein
MIRAIRDANLACQQVTESSLSQAASKVPVYLATCEDGAVYAVAIADDGSATVQPVTPAREADRAAGIAVGAALLLLGGCGGGDYGGSNEGEPRIRIANKFHDDLTKLPPDLQRLTMMRRSATAVTAASASAMPAIRKNIATCACGWRSAMSRRRASQSTWPPMATCRSATAPTPASSRSPLRRACRPQPAHAGSLQGRRRRQGIPERSVSFNPLPFRGEGRCGAAGRGDGRNVCPSPGLAALDHPLP